MIPRPVLAVGLGVFTTTVLVMVFWGALSIYAVATARESGEPPANPLSDLSRTQVVMVIAVETFAALTGAGVTARLARNDAWRCLFGLAAMFLLGGLSSLFGNSDNDLPRSVLAARVLVSPLVVFGLGWIARRRCHVARNLFREA
ncbi:MAG: hypothetical protein FJ295_15080 [Planctomycetes bacterium]|nr:hypothetical protein [Planctomycetota bacterium]